ncbi:MAG TPA: hypothetical protein EYN79_05405 [Planctomycetes bacterium]|nr:hypothetical protein [Planctomycetota bacterium]
MAEGKELSSLIGKFRRLPLPFKVTLVILVFLFILNLLAFQLSTAIRSSSQRSLEKLKAKIGASSLQELFNQYALVGVEKGRRPGLPPDALADIDFVVLQELDEDGPAPLEGAQRLEAIARQEEQLDDLVEFLAEMATAEPFLHPEEEKIPFESASFIRLRMAIEASVESSARAREEGRLEEAVGRITVAIDLTERVSDRPIAIWQMIRVGLLRNLLDSIEAGLGHFREEQLVLALGAIETIDLDDGFEGMVRGEMLYSADVVFGDGQSLPEDAGFLAFRALIHSLDNWHYLKGMFQAVAAPLEIDWEEWYALQKEIPWWAPTTRMVMMSWGSTYRTVEEFRTRPQSLSEALRCLIALRRGEEVRPSAGFRLYSDEGGTWLETTGGERIAAPILIYRLPPPPGDEGSTALPAGSGELDG